MKSFLDISLINIVYLIIIILGIFILHQKYYHKQNQNSSNNNYDLQKYILDDDNLNKEDKPILWIHVPHEYNSRNWLTFGSRSSYELNQPYLHLTTSSIIKHCHDSFRIIIIDDNSFVKLIPDWSINLNTIADPIKDNIRKLALSKLLYIYGGIHVPISFLCVRDLLELYNYGTIHNLVFIGENIDHNITSTDFLMYPNMGLMGTKKHNPIMLEFIDFMQRSISSDFTSQLDFNGDFNRWCNTKIQQKKIQLIAGTDLGTKTIDDVPVSIEMLLGDDYIKFYDHMYGIWIPNKMLLKRTHYNWFCRMNEEQILTSRFILAKYFILACAPSMTENMSTQSNSQSNPENTKDWINFWKVPLTNNTLAIWGFMPQNLGNNVPTKVKGT